MVSAVANVVCVYTLPELRERCNNPIVVMSSALSSFNNDVGTARPRDYGQLNRYRENTSEVAKGKIVSGSCRITLSTFRLLS